VPLTEAADTLSGGGASNPSFAIGGSAFLKPWFDWYRSEATNGSLTIAAGDSVGATPPISNFFGDTPTIELMNAMGFGLDGLGNHNFDRGQLYWRNTLVPLADFPYVSSNLVDGSGNYPAEWGPYQVFDTTWGGVKVGIVGFSNADLVSLTNSAGLAPFVITDPTTAVNAQAAILKSKKINVIVAIGHEGATAGSLTNPTGPLLTLADNVTNVDAVIGDHTNFQVVSTRSNGVLVTENLSKGVRFTRVRLLFDTNKKQVIYKTADFHKPWDIGVTPDAPIQTRIDELNAIIAPTMNAVLGESSKVIPRADQCGRIDGRLCESLVGDVVTDALRLNAFTDPIDFAITNSGGLRADLTCPDGGSDPNANDFCPAGLYPIPYGSPSRYPITRGQVFTVLPFGNFAVRVHITGVELRAMLENAVSLIPTANGKFAQVSGLCFSYNVQAAVGSRVDPLSVVRANPDGTCGTEVISLLGTDLYWLATNDFTASGNEGYPNYTGRFQGGATLDEVLAAYLAANTPINPFVLGPTGGRINCTDPAPGSGIDCPAGFVASPPVTPFP
jgi:2',3'-cyclic-nucleotide 2'-phosphodiesterase (5'-nucleotidase family)